MASHLFVHRAGGKELSADPLTTYVRLAEAASGRLASLLKERRSFHHGPAEYATEQLVAAVREAFELTAAWQDVEAIELLDAFLAVLADQEAKGRELADMVAAYGAGVMELRYTEYVRLWLNLPRVQARQAMAVANGVAIALSNGNIDRAFFDAVAVCPAEGAEAEFEANAARAEQRSLEKRGR